MDKRDRADGLSDVATPPKGILDPRLAREAIVLDRVTPPDDLAPFVEHFWSVAWDLRGRPPHRQRTLPYPVVHLVFDRAEPGVFGVPRGAHDADLAGQGVVLGVRFRPGGFRPWLGRDVSTITGRVVPFAPWLKGDDRALTEEVLSTEPLADRIAYASSLLRRSLPPVDEVVGLTHAIVDRVAADEALRRVDDVAAAAGMGVRDLQRLFRKYVGVSPKWVLRRARLQEAAFRLAGGSRVDLAALAHDLGYFDQAHLTRDFSRLVGRSPGSYMSAQA